MESSLVELKSRVQEIKTGSEVTKLREELSKLIDSPQFKQLSENDRDLVIDLLAKVNSKQDQFKTCDPLDLVSRPGELEA